jgi:predicted phosphodiesterase
VRFAAFSDIHGCLVSLTEMLRLAVLHGAEFLVFAGDMTDAEYSGYAAGTVQMGALCKAVESTSLQMVYVLGNRDRAGGRLVGCPLSGDLAYGDVVVQGLRFTSRTEGLDGRSIYVCHQLDAEFRTRRLPARLVLYGHDHSPRIYGNYIGLGYMRDPEQGSPEDPRGGFFMVDVEGGSTDVRYVNMGGLRPSRCEIHRDQETFFVPARWGKACPLCRNEAKHTFFFP